MPDSVLIPAPVSATMRVAVRESSINSFNELEMVIPFPAKRCQSFADYVSARHRRDVWLLVYVRSIW